MTNQAVSPSDLCQISQVIVVCRDGANFYQFAAAETEDARLKTLFREMAIVRKEVADELSDAVVGDTTAPQAFAGTFLGALRCWYAKARLAFTQQPMSTLISDLEEQEHHTLSKLKNAVHQTENSEYAKLLSRQLASIQMTHDKMLAIKHQYQLH